MPIGAISTAVAVFEMNNPVTAVSTKSAAITRRGEASPVTESRLETIRSMPPVFCSASAKGSMPMIRIRLCQWMAR